MKTSQSDLWEVPALTHRSDPETSRQAAQDIQPHLGGQRLRVLQAVASFGDQGGNHDDVNQIYGWTDAKANRRLGELRQMGLVERLEISKPTRTGSKARIYTITKLGKTVLRQEAEDG